MPQLQLQSLVVDLVANANQYYRVLAQAENRALRISSQIGVMGTAFGAAITVPLAAFGNMTSKAASEFEDSWTSVLKTVDGTEQRLAKLSDEFIALSKNVPVSVNTLHEIGAAAGALGIETDNIIKFSEVMAGLSVTTNLTAERAATELARFANITQMSQDKFENLGSTLVHLGNNFATTESEISEMGMRIAGAGAQVGMSEHQILAIGAALSAVGIEAEAGGTSISKAILLMQNAVSAGGDDLEEFQRVASAAGVDNFGQLFRQDAAAGMLSFIEGLQNIKRSGGDVVRVLTDMGITEVRMRDAILRLVGANDLLSRTFDYSEKGWKENTALAVESSLRYGTFTSQMQMLDNKLKDIYRQIGDRINPVLLKMKENFVALMSTWESLSDTQQQWLVNMGMGAGAAGTVLGALGLLTYALAQVISAIQVVIPLLNAQRIAHGAAAAAATVQSKALSFLSVSMVGVGRAANMMWLAMTAPITKWLALIALVGAAVYGIARLIVGKEGMAAAWDYVSDRFMHFYNLTLGFMENWKENFNAIFTWFRENWQAIFVGASSAMLVFITTSIANWAKFWGTMWKIAIAFWGWAINQMPQLAMQLWEKIVEVFNKALLVITATIASWVQPVLTIVGAVVAGIVAFFSSLPQVIAEIMTEVGRIVFQAWESIKNMEIPDFAEMAAQVAQKTAEKMKDIANNIQEAVEPGIEAAKEMFDRGMKEAQDAFLQGASDPNFFNTVGNMLKEGFGSMDNPYAEAFRQFTDVAGLPELNFAREVVEDPLKDAVQATKPSMDKAAEDIHNVQNGLTDIQQKAKEGANIKMGVEGWEAVESRTAAGFQRILQHREMFLNRNSTNGVKAEGEGEETESDNSLLSKIEFNTRKMMTNMIVASPANFRGA